MSDPTSPVEVGSVATTGYAEGVAVFGTRVYVAEADAGVEVLVGCDFWVFTDGFESGNTTVWSATAP